MVLGIDFDGTYRADPDAFGKVVDILTAAGHTCLLITQRPDTNGWGDEVRNTIRPGMKIIFSYDMSKKQAATEAGYNVDVWVDDNPLSVYNAFTWVGSHQYPPTQL